MRALALFSFFIAFGLSSPAFSSRSVTLPFEEDFNTQAWVSDLSLSECGGMVTNSTSGCFDGGCAKVKPPTSLCTGGGTNGGQTGLGWVSYPGTSRLHVRFLIKFGTTWAQNYSGSNTNKFLLQDAPDRSGILGFNCSGSGSSRYCAFAVLRNDEAYVYRTPPNRGWIEDALFRISSTSHVNEWIAVEYWIDTAIGQTGLYIWDQRGGEWTISGIRAPVGFQQRGFYISYYNGYGREDANNYYLIDNLQVSNSLIGPPEGFRTSDGGSSPVVSAPNGLRILLNQ